MHLKVTNYLVLVFVVTIVYYIIDKLCKGICKTIRYLETMSDGCCMVNMSLMSQ